MACIYDYQGVDYSDPLSIMLRNEAEYDEEGDALCDELESQYESGKHRTSTIEVDPDTYHYH